MRGILLNCDDVGMHPSINRAACWLLQNTKINSCSVMATGVFFHDAVERLRQIGISRVGVHLALNSEYDRLRTSPVSPRSQVPSLIDADGGLWKDFSALGSHARIDEVRQELCEQIELVQRAGFEISHLDGHMFFYEELAMDRPDMYAVVVELADRLKVPHRLQERVNTQCVWDGFNTERERFEKYDSLLRSYARKKGERPMEIILHPADSVEEVLRFSSVALRRFADFSYFQSPRPYDLLEQVEVPVLGWSNLFPKDRQAGEA